MRIFGNMSHIRKSQQRFLTLLFTTLFAVQGRCTFTNLARYSTPHEHTFRRHFARFFDWIAFNLAMRTLLKQPGQRILALDCTFIPKSGTRTYGLDRFWSSAASRSERGLELSVAALIEVGSRDAFTLDATQTPPALAASEAASEADRYSRIDFYMEQFTDCLGHHARPLEEVRYVVADGHYAKQKVFAAVCGAEKHLVTRLRSDANLRFLYRGPRKKGPGAPKRYDGKVCFEHLSRFSLHGALADAPHIMLYSACVNSPYFKRDFRVVVLVNTKTGGRVVLASTDTQQSPHEVVRLYRLRFQIEFLFRDAKQMAGLSHCQARSEEKLDFHFNASLSAVNLARLEIRLYHAGLSLVSYVRQCYNRALVHALLLRLGLLGRVGLNHPQVQQVIRMGRISP